MLIFLYVLNFTLMVVLPISLAFVLQARFKLPWKIWFIGAVTFVLSQVVRLPVLYGINSVLQLAQLPTPTFLAIIITIQIASSGIFEEGARYVSYRFWLKQARTWNEGVFFGTGHGGFEAIIFGGLAALQTINLIAMSSMDLTTLGLPADQLPAVQAQVTAFMTAPWYMTVLGAAERVFAICLHISLSVIVLQAFKRKNILWLFAAMAWHALGNTSVLLLTVIGPVGVESLLGFIAIVSLVILFVLRPKTPELSMPIVDGVATEWQPTKPRTEKDLQQQLDESKYQ